MGSGCRAGLWLALVACGPRGAGDGPDDSDPPVDTDLAPRFTFAVLADPHVTRDDDHAARVAVAVDWLNTAAEAEEVAFVLIAGDTAWGDGYGPLLDALAPLRVPWIPITGDNEIQNGIEADYDAALAPQYGALADTLDGWVRAPTPVRDPERDADAWLQNFSFRWEGVTFVGVDVAARVKDPFYGEFADLYDFPGGTLPFLAERLADLPEEGDDDVVLLTHNPLAWTPGGLDRDELTHVVETLGPDAGRIALALGGHLHVDLELPATVEQPWTVLLTDALFDDTPDVRLVDVAQVGQRFVFSHRRDVAAAAD